MELDIAIENWPAKDLPALAARAAEAAAAAAPELANPRLAVSVLFTTDAEVRTLNRAWRGRDKPTNVLSFPMLRRADLLALDIDGPPELLGDIVLARETCVGEATDNGVPVIDHAAHLLVHGLLHLAGYDHEISDEAEAAMEALEIKALAILGVADPYGDRE